ncbi:MAG: hypothetical protein SF182_29550 [Deltaproteobacteria bacterium]|nr:hypothetical protein [Deltaproteobacteria bacterium]
MPIRSGWVARRLITASLLALLAAPGRAGAQACVGDCGNRGAVGINDLILAVNIVLGLAPLDDCPSLGSGPIGIAELIASVANALCECQPCPEPPTPRATNTRTATPTPTFTPTHTPLPTAPPTATAMVSRWHEDQVKVPSSSCPQALVKQIRQGLAQATADYRVYERGEASEIEDINSGERLPAQVDANRVLHFELAQSESQGACTVTLTLQATVDLRSLATTATYTGGVRSMSCPNPVNCSLKVTSRWQRGVDFPNPSVLPPFSRPGCAYGLDCSHGLTIILHDSGSVTP